MARIETTHTGSLPRPEGLTTLLVEVEEGRAPAGLAERANAAVADVVARQLAVGLDIVNDGEQGKIGYSTYVRDRLSGFSGEPTPRPQSRDLVGHEDFVALSVQLRGRPRVMLPPCTGPIALADPEAAPREVAALVAAGRAAGVGPERLFMSAASPGVIALFFENHYYPSREEYLHAIVEAMRTEYRAIIDAGLTLQLDCPDFAMSYNTVFADLSVDEFRSEVALAVEALNLAVADLPPERIRLHLCWGNFEAPHTHDIALADVIDLVLRANPAGIVLEAANPRHGHEWQVFERVALPEDKYLVVGVLDTTTNFVEHPELIAQRLRNYADLVGPERVMAGNDCGFSTFIGYNRVAPSIVWEKMAAMVEGARLASS
ncbi:MAG TPA: cobalamin-independent methionine synthase II family protein [Acidimicrobiales bacterium]|nr:cobalamin-independent methionine synthase II family protein [Acidimicrobiales bacterium]